MEFQMMEKEVIGIPDKKNISNPLNLEKGLTDLIIHLHDAAKAGKHRDLRILGPEGLYSFATKKELPTPGNSISLFPQPLHSKEYGDFEGDIPEGYGKGKVSIEDKGKVLITYVGPRSIKMTVAHKKNPERFNLIKMKDGSWLMQNVTPQAPYSSHRKLRFKRLESDEVQELFTPENVVTAKIDGSAAIYDLLKDKFEISSYRTTKEGKPIIHTERLRGAKAGDKISLPKELQGTVLRGEIFGTKDNKAITAQQVGGILNATIANSLARQKENNIKMRNLIYNISSYGKKPVSVNTPYDERLKMIKNVLKYLPKDEFELPETARTPQAQSALWNSVTSGQNPLTNEGIVSWPAKGGIATKVKTYPEADVWVTGFVPGTGKFKDKGIGALLYALEKDGPAVGKVGTGFDDLTRADIFNDPDSYIGRKIRIRAQEQFPSGAYRAPAFLSFHEDYPTNAEIVEPSQTEKQGMFTANLLYKIAEETLQVLNRGNRTPRMGATTLKGESAVHPRWQRLTSKAQSNILPWLRGRRINHAQSVNTQSKLADTTAIR
jgi:hypothetical protein